MTLKDILERANACAPMLSAAERYQTFAEFWASISDPEYLTWLLRRCPDEFEDSRRDLIEALHAVCVARRSDALTWLEARMSQHDVDRSSCTLIRLYVRLRVRGVVPA